MRDRHQGVVCCPEVAFIGIALPREEIDDACPVIYTPRCSKFYKSFCEQCFDRFPRASYLWTVKSLFERLDFVKAGNAGQSWHLGWTCRSNVPAISSHATVGHAFRRFVTLAPSAPSKRQAVHRTGRKQEPAQCGRFLTWPFGAGASSAPDPMPHVDTAMASEGGGAQPISLPVWRRSYRQGGRQRGAADMRLSVGPGFDVPASCTGPILIRTPTPIQARTSKIMLNGVSLARRK